jgi:CO dehydrogenase maturation factor
VVVANRVRSESDREAVAQFCLKHGLELIASIPFDEAIVQAEQHEQAPVDYAPQSPAVRAVRDLVDTLDTLVSQTR